MWEKSFYLFNMALLVSFSSLAQVKKSTLSTTGGEAKVNSHTIFYAVGQSAMIGQQNLGNKKFIHGYLNPIRSYVNNAKIPVEWTVYPNPFKEQFNIQFPFDINIAKVQLYDLKGMQVFGRMVQNSPSSVKISQLGHLASASYLLVIEHEGMLYQRQIIHD